MRVLLDEYMPNRFRRELPGHDVATIREMGWAGKQNCELLASMQSAGIEVLITVDQNLRYQQNLAGRRLAILVLPTTRWPILQRHVAEVAAAVASMQPGGFRELNC